MSGTSQNTPDPRSMTQPPTTNSLESDLMNELVNIMIQKRYNLEKVPIDPQKLLINMGPPRA